VRNGSYLTRTGRRPQWRCRHGCGVLRRASIYYRRRWGESRINFIAAMFRLTERWEIVDTVRVLSAILEIPTNSLRRVRRSLIRGSRALNHLTKTELEQCAQENYQWLLQVLDREDAPYRFDEPIHRLRLAFSERYTCSVSLR
jgi:hypothetical protein